MKTKSKMRSAAGLAMAGLMLVGCVQSLNPLYTEEDLVFEPKLVGVWAEEEESKDRWTFEKAGEKAYRLIYEEDGEQGEFEVHLLRLGEQLYLDFFPDKEAIEKLDRNDFYKYHWLPAHTFARVYAIEPELKMAFMNPDWLNERLSENENLIAHVRRGENEVVLTASTEALQEFVRKHDSAAFGDVSKLQRIGKPGK
jgi:hypothetical protein